MLKRAMLPVLALAALLLFAAPRPASAEVHFGVYLGAPAYAYPAYPYYPYYSGYAPQYYYYGTPYPSYVYPAPRWRSYNYYRYDRRRDRDDRDRWRYERRGHRDNDDRRWRR
jgi:hypothetical protein